MEERISTVVIDDETGARESLTGILTQYFEMLEVIGEADSVKSGLKIIEEKRPRLVFLDVQMRDGTGFDLLELCMQREDIEVIFVTAFDNYALNAFRAAAIDYLLKPVRIKDLRQAIEKAQTTLASRQSRNGDHYRVLLDNHNSSENGRKRIVIPDLKGFQVVEVQTIIRMESSGNYTQIFMTDGNKFTVSKLIKDFEEMLDGNDFMRVHQSHLINLSHVVRYHRGNAGDAEMTDGYMVPISRNKKQDFLDHFA